MKITNFGGNVQFEPKHWYAPKTEQEVLDILNSHAAGNIRVMASGHCWSEAVVSDDVTIDMRHINQVEIEHKEKGEAWATVGAGCVLQDLLDTLHKKSEYTLPTMGGIKKQTIAGVISTGTHGSGRPSVSHYMQEVRVAAYDADGQAKIYTYTEGDELRAARCALGCMGIILSVKFQLVPKYYVTQSIEKRDSLDAILAEKETYELQQFVLLPYCWQYVTWARYVAAGPSAGLGKLHTYWNRLYSFISEDVLLHVALKIVLAVSSSRKGKAGLVRWFVGSFLPFAIERKTPVTDFHEPAITLRHDLFRHLEMELFVPEANMKKAMAMVQYITSVFADVKARDSLGVTEELKKIGKADELMEHKGFFTHHYPIYCRQIKPDDTLISMTAQAESWYFSLSLFTYLAPNKREHFYEFATFVASCLVQSCEARVHWGKYFPLAYEDVKHLYPRMQDFHRMCNTVDPNKVFRNEYTTNVLGFHD